MSEQGGGQSSLNGRCRPSKGKAQLHGTCSAQSTDQLVLVWFAGRGQCCPTSGMGQGLNGASHWSLPTQISQPASWAASQPAQGAARHCTAQETAWQRGRHGTARHGTARHGAGGGSARHGKPHGMARHRTTRHRTVRRGTGGGGLHVPHVAEANRNRGRPVWHATGHAAVPGFMPPRFTQKAA